MPDTIFQREVWLCVCCVMAAANADTSGHDASCTDEPEPLGGLLDDEFVIVGDEIRTFSTVSCDGCFTMLAGERHTATICAVV